MDMIKFKHKLRRRKTITNGQELVNYKKEVIILNIYVAHSTQFDYIKKLYEPIKNAKSLSIHNFFFSHDEANKLVKTKEIIKNYDLVIAEVSLLATGLGIELGWADYTNTPILCIYEKGARISSSLKFITNNFIEYDNAKELVEKINDFLNNFTI